MYTGMCTHEDLHTGVNPKVRIWIIPNMSGSTVDCRSMHAYVELSYSYHLTVVQTSSYGN